MRAPWSLALGAWLLVPALTAAQPCFDPNLIVQVRVTQLCEVSAASTGVSCLNPQTDAIVDAFLQRVNAYLPVCLRRQGAVRYDLTRPAQTRTWEEGPNGGQDTLAALGDKTLRPDPAWDTIDLFLVEEFRKLGKPTNIGGQVGRVAYSLRPKVRKVGRRVDKTTWRDPLCVEEDGIVVKRTMISHYIKPNPLSDVSMAHEIGHWLGLLHTFSGCDDNDFGDDIESTVAETSNPLLDPLVAKGGVIGDLEIETKSKFVGCDAYPLFLKLMPFNRNSCNQKYDAAAILNIMEYGECMKRFNADQKSVMLDVWKRRRELQRLGQRCSGP